MTTSKLLLNSALRAATHVNSAQIPKTLIKSSAAFLSSAPSGGKHTLPDLPYDYNALEGESTFNLLCTCSVSSYEPAFAAFIGD